MASGKYATDFIGGTADCLDYYDGAALANGDIAIVQNGGMFYPYILNATSGATESSPDIIAPDSNPGTKRWILQKSYGGFFDAYVKVSDTVAANTDGGGFTSGSYVTRNINTEDSDEEAICSISSNQITLPAGTYICRASAPAYRVSSHKARLYNVTGTAVLLVGDTAYAPENSNGHSRSTVVGMFTLSVQSAVTIEHRCGTTRSSEGLGLAANLGEDEVYTVAEFWRLS